MPGGTLSLDPPRGMRDFYPEDLPLRDAVFQAWRAAARASGFRQYDACVVESLDLFRRKAGEEIVEQIYAFKDKSDRDLALRPEMTPTLARMIAARRGQLAFPLKWYAIAQCFRYERTTRGRKREHYQWNLDIVGEPSVAAEAEVIACALDALERLGLAADAVQVRLSSRALLADLLARAGIEPARHAATFLALDKRGKLEEAAIGDLLRGAGLGAAAVEAVFGLLRIETLDQVAAALGEPTPAFTALRNLLELLGIYGVGDRVVFDIGVVRGLGYYTGAVFEAFDGARRFRALFGGGRYDNLLNDVGGTPLTAVGLGFGDVVIAELLADRGFSAVRAGGMAWAIGFMEAAQQPAAVRLAQALRRAGWPVDLALQPENPRIFFGRAGRGDFQRAVYLGPDDLARGTVRIKDLAARAEEERPLADLLDGRAPRPAPGA